MKQCTLKNSFTVSGKGLHTGMAIEATFRPAPVNHGYKFQRIDLDDKLWPKMWLKLPVERFWAVAMPR